MSDEVLPLVLLLMAVKEEASAVLDRLRDSKDGLHLARRLGFSPSPRLHVGRVGDCLVLLHLCGTGPRKASAAARGLLDVCRPALVMSAGLGGALQPELREGDLVLARRVLDLETGEGFEADPRLLGVALSAQSAACPGDHVVATVDHIVGTSAEKARLASRASVVDMESAAVARAAAGLGVPFLSVRVISDAADMDFPIDLNRYVDAHGNLQRARLAGAALCQPRGIPFLLHLRKMAVEGSRTLSRFMETFCRAVPSAL